MPHSLGTKHVASAVGMTESDAAAYQRDGVVHLRGAFSDAWVSLMRDGFRDAMEQPGAYAEFIGSGVTWDSLFDSDAKTREIEMFQDQIFFEEAMERVPAWVDVVQRSPAAAMIASLMLSRTATFFYAHVILKRGGGGDRAIPWHQDLPYWKVDGEQIGSVWIALDDMPIAASVRYIRGSHRWGLFRPQHFVDASPYQGRDELPLLPDVDDMLARGEAEALAFDVAPGDAVCFDARIVHGSFGNPIGSGRDHRRVALRFGGDDAAYCARSGETAIPTPEVDASHGLRHGDRLACKTFPLVWPGP